VTSVTTDSKTASPTRRRKPRTPREFTSTDVMITVACFVSALSLCWLVFSRLTGGIGWFGFGLAVFASFLVLLFIVNADRLGSSVAADRVVTAAVFTIAAALFVPLVSIVAYVVWKGVPALRLHFFFEDQRGITPTMPATAGGGSHAVVGTLEQVGLALMWSLPLGVCAAIFLNESRSKWRRPVRIFVDAMSGLPSIMCGLFIYAVLILPYARSFEAFGTHLFSYNGLMASLALSITMVPTITRTVEVVLRLVPDGLREASLALGSSRTRTVWSVVLPTASTGIATAVVLGVARVVGETAPLLLTAFGYDLMTGNPIDGPQESLPLFVFRNIRKPNEAAVSRGFAGALVLLTVVIMLFIIARIVGRDRSARMRRGRRGRSRSARVLAPELSSEGAA
jgi:phosphate transport system permease protein